MDWFNHQLGFFKSSQSHQPDATESTITSLKEELLEAKKQIEKLKVSVKETTPSGTKHTLSLQGIRQRMQMLENQVKQREESLAKLQRWQVSQQEPWRN